MAGVRPGYVPRYDVGGPPPRVFATAVVSPQVLRDGNLDVTPVVFSKLTASLMRELDNKGMELAGPVTFHQGVRDELSLEVTFRAEAPARPYGSRDRVATPYGYGVPGSQHRPDGTEGGNHLAAGPQDPLKGTPWVTAGGSWLRYDESVGGVVPCPPPNVPITNIAAAYPPALNYSLTTTKKPVKKKENPVGDSAYASNYTTTVSQTRAGYVGQVRVEVDGENVIVWESAPVSEATTGKSRQKAAAAAKVALRKGIDAVFANVTVTDDEVTALLPDDKSNAA